MIVSVPIFLLAAMGFLISLYFTLVYYRWIKADQRYIPNFCRMEEGTCQQIVHTKEARLFGLPNSVLGICYYLLVVIISIIPTPPIPTIYHAIVMVSAVTVLLGIYLSYVLIVRLRMPCVLCFTSHTINGCIFLIFIFEQQ